MIMRDIMTTLRRQTKDNEYGRKKKNVKMMINVRNIKKEER